MSASRMCATNGLILMIAHAGPNRILAHPLQGMHTLIFIRGCRDEVPDVVRFCSARLGAKVLSCPAQGVGDQP